MDSPPNRREYLGVAGIALIAGIAGCLGDDDSEDGEKTTRETVNDGTDQTPLVTGGDAPFEPFLVNDTPDELTGFDVEMLETVIGEMDGYVHDRWVIVDVWPDDFIEAINNGEIDIGAAGVTILEEREQNWGVRFSDPYFSINQAFFVKAGSDFQPSNPADLAGKTIGAQQETTGAMVVEGFIEDGILEEDALKIYSDINEDVMPKVENGTLDAGVIDHPVAQSRTDDYSIEIAFEVETGEAYGFVVDDGREELLEALNDGIETVRNNEALVGGLVSKWF